MVRGLGLPVKDVEAPFEPESGAYGGHAGHAHPHGHSAEGEGSFGTSRPRIHDHFQR
jgi:urease accessory protein